jgi:hypothetical protein
VKAGYFPWYFLAMSTMGLTIYLHCRAYLRRVVPLHYAKSQG